MDEVIIDGVAYVRLYASLKRTSVNASGFLDQYDEKERNKIRRRMMAHLVEAGYFMRKDGYEKKNSIYQKDELFYGL
jgi:hypothetical protein